MTRLKKRWYSFTLIGILVALSFMVAYNYWVFNSNVTQNMNAIGLSNLSQAAEELESYLDRGMGVVQTTAVSIEYMMDNHASTQDIENFLVYESMRYTEEIDEDFTGIYGLFNGKYIDGIGWVPDEDYDPRTREWYTTAIQEKGEPVIVSPYLDAQTDTIMISISKMLSDGDSVLSLDIAMNQIQEITERINLHNIGYGFVIDRNGLVVAHNDIGEKGKNYLEGDSQMQQLITQVYAQEQNCFPVELNGEHMTVFSNTVMDDWNVVMIVSNDALFADAQNTLRQNIVICGAISVLIITFYIVSLVKINQSLEREMTSNKKIEEVNQKIIRALVRTIDAKDHYTNGHSIRVAEYSKEIARRMKKTEKEQENIYYAGLLHDIGKIRVPDEVINKTGKLTNEEYEQIKVHPLTSFHILKDIYDDNQIAVGAKYHHERYDGKGYPNGLMGDSIPEIARIIAVADTYDAMASNRSYRKALPQNMIRSEMESGKGKQFDPKIADIMIQMIDEDESYTLKETNSYQKRVLVVDDEPIYAKLIEGIMRDDPMYEIVSVSSGEKALELLEEQDIDIILLDRVMPKMDGFETLEHIQKKYKIPVVFMSADKNPEDVEKAAGFGVEYYLTKPFYSLDLKEIIHSILY